MNCSSSKDGCSLSGALDAMGSGALAGAIVGALGGAAGGSGAESGESGAGETPAVGESSDAASGEAAPASVESAPAEAAPAAEPEAAPEESPEEEQSCPIGPHSFVGSTPVLMADGSTKPISQVKVGDQVTDAVPGDSAQQTHAVQNVIVTQTDHDFVDLTIKKLASKLGNAVAGIAVAAAAVLGTAAPASADTPSTLTTTYHHPFYDITQSAFVEAVDLKAGDQVQTADGGTATVTDVHAYHQQATTYDLTINGLHTYYVLAGDTTILVHNTNADSCPVVDAAVAEADALAPIRPESARSGVAEAIELPDGRTIAHGSYRGDNPPALHPDIQSALDEIPADARGRGHGRCGLAYCLSDALSNGDDPTGSDAAAVLVRGDAAHPKHGYPVGPCPSCRPLVGRYQLNFVTDDGR